VCYYPYARSVWKGLNLVPNTITNKTEWAAASGIPATAPSTSGTSIALKNPGDLETDINIITAATSGTF
jgi:hypothetical protein